MKLDCKTNHCPKHVRNEDLAALERTVITPVESFAWLSIYVKAGNDCEALGLSYRHNSKVLFRAKHSEMLLLFKDVLETSALPCASFFPVNLKMTQTQIICCGETFKISAWCHKNKLAENIPAGCFSFAFRMISEA